MHEEIDDRKELGVAAAHHGGSANDRSYGGATEVALIGEEGGGSCKAMAEDSGRWFLSLTKRDRER